MEKAEHHMERIMLDRKLVDEIEQDMLIRRHIERYALVRQYAFGRVIDAACGVGYGTYLVSKNPDVEEIVGVDCDKETIKFAKENYEGGKISFECKTFDQMDEEFDVMLSLETIEHLEHPEMLAEMAKRCNVKEIIVSYPTKKTTHYNKFHLWDFDQAEIKYIFRDYECIRSIINGDSEIMHFIQREKYGIEPKKYLHNR